jgi:sugar (pentulose or hexulose) kinase
MGIDIGTSVSKAAIFDELGNVVAVASQPLELEHPGPNQVEQNAQAVLASVLSVVSRVRAEVGGDAPDIVGITGQGDGCWLLDERGAPSRRAISWMDGRAQAKVGEWERAGINERIFAINGNTLFPGCMASILSWLDEHEPAALDAATTAGYCKDMVFQAFTGERATDASDASLPFGNATGDGYSTEALELVGLGHRAGLLAPIATPLPAAPVNLSGADELGLDAGTPVVAGPFDLPACAMGSGVTELGDGLLIVGTTLACQVLVDRIDTSGAPAGMSLSTPRPGRWMRAMPSMVGTASLDWILRVLDMKHKQIDKALRNSSPGAGGVETLPYFAPSGERAPFIAPEAVGQFVGIQLTTTRHDLIRATCEGLAYAARDCFEAAGLTGKLMVAGGGARSVPWLRIFASVLNRPLYVAASPQVGAKGAVQAALDIVGVDYDRHEWGRPATVIEPEPDLIGLYDDGFGRYQQLRDAARPLWRTK